MFIWRNGTRYRKSGRSGASGNCLGVAERDGVIRVIDTKTEHEEMLEATPADWQAVLDMARR